MLKPLKCTQFFFVLCSVFLVCALIDVSYAEEPLPIAPKRYDIRDELPPPAYVSITGEDPQLPGEKPNEHAVAQKQNMKPAEATRVPASKGLKTKAKSTPKKNRNPSGQRQHSSKKLPSKKK